MILLAAVMMVLAGASELLARPAITPPALAIVHADAGDNPDDAVYVSITGSGFGAPAAARGHRGCGTPRGGAYLELRRGHRVIQKVPSVGGGIVSWKDARIVARLASRPGRVRIRVCTPHGRTRRARIDTYVYQHFDVPKSPGTNASPLALAIDSSGGVWINEEFHLQLKTLDPSSVLFSAFDIPENPAAPPFATSYGGDTPSRISEGGEDVMVAPNGRIWFTEAGGGPGGPVPNHSRVVEFDPSAAPDRRFRAYNVPGDENSVVGVTWDATRKRIWFSEARRATKGLFRTVAYRARVVSFDPETIAPDNEFAFPIAGSCAPNADPSLPGSCTNVPARRCLTSYDCILAEQVCAPAAAPGVPIDDAHCYHEYELPRSMDTALPGHIAIHPDRSIWFTAYFGANSVGRLDPESGAFRKFALADPIRKKECDYGSCSILCEAGEPGCTPCSRECVGYAALGSAPWDITTDARGDVVFTEYNNNAVGWISRERQSDPRCETLRPDGRSDCVREYFVPGADFAHQQVHSLAIDPDQNVWFTQGDDLSEQGSGSSVGYLRKDRRGIVLFPPLSLYPMLNSDGSHCGSTVPLDAEVNFTGAGIAIDPSNGSVWFADYCRQRLGLLSKLLT